MSFHSVEIFSINVDITIFLFGFPAMAGLARLWDLAMARSI